MKKKVKRNFQNYALCGLDMDCLDGGRLKQLRQYFVYCEVAEGGVPAVQGMARTHEGVSKVPLKRVKKLRLLLALNGKKT